MAAVDLEAKANFTRLSRLIVDKGTEALRKTFDGIHPPASLQAVLCTKQKSLLRLKFRVINNTQWDLLYPSGNPPDSKTFDVTLLTVLFRNICRLSSTGWDAMPVDTDRSVQANIVRIKSFRNEVYAHATSTQVDSATFESLWQKISQALVELNIPQKDVDDLKTNPLGPEEEIYVRALKDWKLHEEEYKTVLEDLNNDVKSFERSIGHLTQMTEENRDGIKKLCQSRVQQQSDKEASQSSMTRPSQLVEDANIEKNRSKDEDRLRNLAKHNFKGKIRGKVKFFHPGTREWLLKKVDEWFIGNEHESNMLLLTAGPGFGKSVFAAKVCEEFKKKGKLAGCHFCDFNDSNLRDPMMMLQSLASQLCENVAGFKEKLLDQLKRPHQVRNLKDAFGIYLRNPLDELEVEEPSLVVIDGLDESAADDKNEIVALIADYFPDLSKCIKFLVTSRPEISIAKQSGLPKINIGNNDAKNNSDLEIYLKARLPSLPDRKADNDSGVFDTLVAKCEGSFLYAFYAQSELQKRDNLDKVKFHEIFEFIPYGLDSIYQAYFKRLEDELQAIMCGNLNVLRLLEMLVASEGPLPLNFVTQALGLAPDCRETKKIIIKVNETVSCLLNVSDDLTVTVFHNSVIDWLLARGYQDHEYTVKVSDGHRLLWLLCKQVLEELKKTLCSEYDLLLTNDDKYALVYGLLHIVAWKMNENYSWLVDVVITYILLTTFHDAFDLIRIMLYIWRDILRHDVPISDELRARISWHIIEIEFVRSRGYLSMTNLCLIPRLNVDYLLSVLTHSPKGYFSDDEKKIVQSLLSKFPRFVDFTYQSINQSNYDDEVEVMPLAVWHLTSKKTIKAVGVSKNKTMAAVAQKNGIIFVVSVPRLVELWQYSTEYECISCCTFAPDDSFVLFGKLKTALNIAERKVVPFFHRNKETFASCAFSPNGKRLVTSNGSSTIKLWDVTKQSLLSSLCADVPVNWCSFSSTGLFIIGDWKSDADDSTIEKSQSDADDSTIKKSQSDADDSTIEKSQSDADDSTIEKSQFDADDSTIDKAQSDTDDSSVEDSDTEYSEIEKFDAKDSFCVWNAITIQRSDERNLRKTKEGNALQSKLCKCCFAPAFATLPSLQWSTGIYNGVECSFVLGKQSLNIIENTHFTTLAVWNIFVDDIYNSVVDSSDDESGNILREIVGIENDQWLYADARNLIVFRTLVTTCPTTVFWSSFAPNSSRLATCTSDGCINIWNVDTREVQQRFKTNQGESPFVCWWSEKFLFVFDFLDRIPSLSKYPVDINLKIQFTQGQQVSLGHLVEEFVSVVDFSEGFLCFEYGTTKSVKVLDVNAVGGPGMVTLPGIQPTMNITVSSGASFVFGGGKDKCYIWKRNARESAVYDVFFTQALQFYCNYLCCFSNDSEVAVVYDPVDALFADCEIIDLDTGNHKSVSFSYSDLNSKKKLFCISKGRVVIAASPYFIDFVDMDSGACLRCSIQPLLTSDFLMELSPNETTLAFPKINGDMKFLRLSIPQSPLLSSIKDKAAIQLNNIRKEYDHL